MSVEDSAQSRRTEYEGVQQIGAAVGKPPIDEVTRVLKQRAQRLARPLEAPLSAAHQLDLLVFRLGGARYGVETTHVVEVIAMGEVTRVPCTPAFVLGVNHYRGRALPLLDLRALLSLETSTFPSEANVVVVRVDGMIFGIGVDQITGVVPLDANDLVPVVPAVGPGQQAFVRHVTGDMAGVLDLAALCQSGRIMVNDGA